MATFRELLEEFFYRPDEEPGAFFADSQELEAPPTASTPAADEPFLAFRLGDETYAVPLVSLREIVKVPPLTELPRARSNLVGAMNLRGEVLPVYDVKVRLGLASRSPRVAEPECEPLPRLARILVCHHEEGDLGLLVDEVSEVVRLSPDGIEKLPPGVGAREEECARGLGRARGNLYILLDVGRAVS